MTISTTIRRAALLLIGATLLGTAVAAEPIEIGGTEWACNGGSSKRGLDERHVIRAKKPFPSGTPAAIQKGLRRPMKGWASGDGFVVGFPTADTFVLRTSGYEITSGTVQRRGNTISLVLDAAGEESFLEWTEDELERFWNAGVNDLGLDIALTELSAPSFKLKLKQNKKTGEPGGYFSYSIKFAGSIDEVVGYRGLGVAVTGTDRQRSKIVWTDAYSDPDDDWWYPF